MIEHKVKVRIPGDRRITYDEFRNWCIKVGAPGEYDPDYCSRPGRLDYLLQTATLDEDLAILFRLEFNV